MATFDQRDQHVTTQYNAEHITTIQGISEERHERLAAELGVTRSALTSFFKILEQQQVPPEDLDSTLRRIATSYQELQAKLQRLTSDDPVVTALKQQARDAVEAGEFAHAEALLNAASDKDLEVAQQLQEVATTRLRSAAVSRAANGDLKRTQLAYAEAAEYYRQAVDMVESVPTARQELAEYLNAWGLTALEAGAYPIAEPLFQRALALREQELGPDHPDTATSLNNLAELYRAQGRYGEAEPLYQRALALCERVLGADHPDTAMSLNNLAALYDAQGRYGEAEPLYQRALVIYERVLGADHPDTATVRENYTILLQHKRREAAPSPSLWQRFRTWLSGT
jgi:tetratricopeptide (TPR) repeat protein